MACECGGRGLFPDPVKSYLDWSGDLARFGFKLERTIAMMWEAMMEPLPDELPDLPDELGQPMRPPVPNFLYLFCVCVCV